ncbi:hypothetical protein DITRI_Ditri17bG0043100 [Diplodiscus trichospermus]
MHLVAPSNIVVGSLVWVEDPEVAWIDGEVKEVNGEEITINCTSEKTVVAKISDVYPKDPEFPSCGVDDMTKLAYLHDPGLLQNLKCRYDINEIYTYTGNILIAVNPFRSLPHLYDNHIMEQYKGAAWGEMSPHPFAVADSAYRKMINEGISQSILVSGESGAGKTESTKMLMRYLAYMGGRANKPEERSVEQKVLESNPVLEAFGNAKTVRNNNSSRFGKFVEIQFDQRGSISGAAIRTYLLERSRVCQVSDPERNYHCFYMLCAGAPEDVEKYKLGNARTFHYLNQSNCYELDAVDDSKDYLATRRAMDVVGISQAEQDAIFRVVAAILHLGNVDFAKGQETDAAEPKDDKSRFHLKTAAELFMCDEKSLEDSLCKRVIVTRGESITKSLDPDAATVSRDALAKIVYSKLFDWLVDKINVSISQDPGSKFLIGVLDIYGFESFKTNSFEQFCINLTNEKLQQHFNQHVFKMVQEEYKKEEIDWSYIDFVDNQDILDLIEKKPGGIIALLDEACMFPRSTHETFAQKLYQTFKDHKRFSKPKLARTDFTICHYAGDVTYQTELFLDKNKDYVVPEHQALLGASKCSFVSSLFPHLPQESSKSSKFSSIGSRFKQQLQVLLETLSATEPHYIRCVKPNNALKPAIFENNNVLQQLQCGGVMEAIRISCAGFPSRKVFSEFIVRFAILAPEVLCWSYGEVTAIKRILEKSNLSGYQIGKTKVFLRAGQMAELDACRSEVLGRSASVIQRKVHTYLGRKHFVLLQLSVIQIQALCRGQVARHQYEGMRREAACLNIQKHLRKFLARKTYKNLCFSAVSIQAGMRGMTARNDLLSRKQTRAATLIQSHCRQFLASLHYLRLQKAAISTQSAWRARVARRELRKLKMAAKETGALQEAKSKLEKQVEELTRCLQLEKQMRVDLEESKNQENARLQSALDKMQLEFQETKELLIKECEAAKNSAEQVPVFQEVPVVDDELMSRLTADNEQLKALVSSLEQKIDETEREYEEYRNQESARLQSAVQKMELEFRETKGSLMKEREAAKNSAEQVPATHGVPPIDDELMNRLTAENEQLKALVSSLEQKIDETERMYEEYRNQESARLQSAVRTMQLEFRETKGFGMKECEAPNNSAEHVLATQEVPVIDDELMIRLTVENEQLKALVSSLEQKIDETERKYEEYRNQESARLQSAFHKMQLEFQETKGFLMKEFEAAKNCAEQVPSAQVVPVIDDELMNRLSAENEQLKALVSSLEQKIDETERKYEEYRNQESARLQSALQKMQFEFQETKGFLMKECEAARNSAEQVAAAKEVPVIDVELMNRLIADNEQLKALVSSLEQKIDETERKYQQSVNQESARLQSALHKMQLEFQETKGLLTKECEATKNSAEQVPVIQEVPDVDDELMNRLTAENKRLKALVSSLEQKIDEIESRFDETNKVSEERLKQAMDAEMKIIELKTTMQRLEEKILDMETEDQILRQQALLSAPSRTMSEHLSIVASGVSYI